MDARHFQHKSRRFLSFSAHALGLFLSILIFEGWAEIQKAESTVRVKVTAYGCCNGDCPKLAGVTVSGGGSATTGPDGTAVFTASPGKHPVTATAQGYHITSVGWSGSWVQEDGVDLKPDEKGYCTDRSVEAEFKGPPENVQPGGEFDEELNVSLVCDSGCKETEKQKENARKEVAVTVASEDCKDFDWTGSKINFSPPGGGGIPISMISEYPSVSLNKSGLAQSKTELRPGTYSLNFYVPHLSDPEDPLYTGAVKTSKVEVYRAFQKRELVGTYTADEKGSAAVTLAASLWKDNNVPYIRVYVEKLCDVRYATIEFFQGQVEVTENNEGVKPEPKPAQAGMDLFKNDTIKIAPGGSVQLKSQGGIYLIKMSVPKDAEPAQMNIGTVITADGRKFIEASTNNTAKIEITRVAVPKPPPPQPNTNELPEPLPEPMPVSVKTPTLKTTDKQTAYMVSYDKKTNTTTVGVEEGLVEITPTNSSLKPFTLVASQQVQVTEKSMSAITAYSGSGGNARILIYTSIGVAALLALFGLLYLFRRQRRAAMRPAFYPVAANPVGWAAPPANITPPPIDKPLQKRCPNSQCGKVVPAGKKFCTSCGTRLI